MYLRDRIACNLNVTDVIFTLMYLEGLCCTNQPHCTGNLGT